MWKAALSGVLLLLILGGCTAPKPTSGWVSRARVGGQYSDFIYRDGQGVERLLRNQLGDYTVLLFSRCDDNSHGPISKLLTGIIEENRRASMVKVIGIDIHTFYDKCDHSQCHLVAGQEDTLSICDATGAIRRLYGVEQADQLVVIGPDHRVAYSSRSEKSAELRSWLRSRVAALSDRRAEELAQEYESIDW